MMRKIASVLCLFILGASLQVMADEHDGSHSLNYSVYQSYMYMKGVNPDKLLATQQQAKKFLPGWNATPDKLSGLFMDMYGPAIAVRGNTNMQKAQQLMAGKLAAMGVNAAEWSNTRNVSLAHAAFVDFSRVVAGHKVVFSNLSFRFTPDGRLQRVKMQNSGTPEPDLVPTLTKNDVLNGAVIMDGIAGARLDKKEIADEWEWFPIPSNNGYVMHPAWHFNLAGTGVNEETIELSGYIDAITGALLYRSSSVNETFDVTVKASIYPVTPLTATAELPVNDIRVTIGSTNYSTDNAGLMSVPSVTAPASIIVPIRGDWSNVRIGGNTPQFTATIASSPATYVLPLGDSTTANFRAVSAFYYVNKVHDYMKDKFPAFTGMDKVLTTNVDLTNNQQCNANYADGNFSINFYPPQGNTCRAFSEVSDIVFHEYGHGISYRFYSAGGTFFQNGALGEGNSDVWAMCINRDGLMGEGSYFNGANIRNYTGAPKVYPVDIISEVHGDGEIIAGAWWDVAVNTNVDTMSKLFALTYYDLPNGPTGTEGNVYHDILISALMNDDDDANLANGTPHFQEIVKAFARHGILLLSDATIEHTEVAHQPANSATTITGKLTLSNPAFFDKLYLQYRSRYGAATWDSVVMVNTTGNEYTAQIPGYPAGAIIDYYFKAQDIVNTSSFGLPKGYSPAFTASEVTLPYQYGIGMNNIRYKMDFEGNADGWTLGMPSDNATGGVWVQAVPEGTTYNGLDVQTGKDHTTGTGKCLVTGNGPQFGAQQDYDVDNGTTTVQTPFFDLPFYEPVVEYYRWYSNDRGTSGNLRGDYWTVEMHMPGSFLWKRVDYTKESDQKWRRRIFRVSEYFMNATSMQMQFIAEDRVTTGFGSGQNTVEAAVDDFIIYEGAPLGVDNTATTIRAEVYPNPADDMVNVVVPDGSKGSISLYDVTGKIISKVNVADGNTRYHINTESIAAGTYMVLVQTQYAVQNATVVVRHK